MKSLYSTIHSELERIDSLEIKASETPDTSISDMPQLGEIVIDFQTQEKEYSILGMNFTRQVPVAKLDDVRNYLSKNPNIGEPILKSRLSLHYERLIGEKQVSEHQKVLLFEHVSVRLNPHWLGLY